MTEGSLEYKIALAMTQGVTAEVVREMECRGVTPEDFFSLDMGALGDALEMNIRFQDLNRQETLFRARKEIDFIERHSIRAISILDEEYPLLLREIPDAPVMLYVLGEADLNAQPIMGVVGSRRPSAYGANFCGSLIGDLAPYFSNLTIVSGLAYGIDTCAHTAALENGLPTIAVVAHGLDMVYPAANRDLAAKIVRNGGAIVSEYPTATRPFRGNFLERNRIVAGLSELTFVVESEVKGGAMSTANQAFSYSREVMALPGRITDPMSQGCNHLISRQKAHIFTNVADMMRLMGWVPEVLKSLPKEKNLFPELEGDQAKVYEYLRNASEPVAIDEFHQKLGISMPSLMEALADLEFEGIIVKLPGARYDKA